MFFINGLLTIHLGGDVVVESVKSRAHVDDVVDMHGVSPARDS